MEVDPLPGVNVKLPHSRLRTLPMDADTPGRRDLRRSPCELLAAAREACPPKRSPPTISGVGSATRRHHTDLPKDIVAMAQAKSVLGPEDAEFRDRDAAQGHTPPPPEHVTRRAVRRLR